MTSLAATPAPGVCSGQETPAAAVTDPTGLDAQLAAADALFTTRRYDEARAVFEQVLASATAAALDAPRARALLGLGSVSYYKRETTRAAAPAREALALYERLGHKSGIGRATYLLSLIEETAGRNDEARRLAERAVAALDGADDFRFRARATIQLQELSKHTPEERRSLLERLAAEAHAAGDARVEGSMLHALGDSYYLTSQFEQAMEALNRAIPLLERADDPVELGTVYNSLGRVYRAHGRVAEALKLQQTALAIHEKAGDPFFLLQSHNAVAVVQQLMGDVDTARDHFERALAIAERSASASTRNFLQANVGSLLITEGRYADAARAFEQVIARGLDQFASVRYGQLSLAYIGLGRHREAMEAAEQAVARCDGVELRCVNALTIRARAQGALGNVAAAVADVDAALARLEAERTRLLPTDFFKQNFHLAHADVYGAAIALQVAAGEPARALETAESARLRAFLDLLATRELRPKDASPPSTNRDVTGAPATAADLAATATRLTSTMVAYWVTHTEVFIWVVPQDGRVHVRRVPVLRQTLASLVRATQPFPEPDPTSAPKPPSTATARHAFVTRGAMTLSPALSSDEAWRKLHALLVAPIGDVLPRTPGALLTIVPQGPLLNLSFAALRNPRGRYLLEDYTLHYAPAGALFQFTASRQHPDARTGPLLLVSDPIPAPVSGLDRPLPRLPGARSETQAIARLAPRRPLLSLRDATATEANVRDGVGGKVVLHFATHAIVRDDDPFASYLALGRSPDSGAAGDGVLTADEIYRLDLNAELVVLSACRSAGGVVTGDGISTFARAFTFAGTASLLASLWDVADEPTNRLLPDFYRIWQSGASRAGALRRAQLRLLGELRAGRVRVATAAGPVIVPEHPVFWAGFALFGEPGQQQGQGQ